MDKIEIYRGFEIRAFEREQGRWRAEIRKADGSTLKILVGDSGHRMSITTSADTLTAETSIDEVKKAIDDGIAEADEELQQQSGVIGFGVGGHPHQD